MSLRERVRGEEIPEEVTPPKKEKFNQDIPYQLTQEAKDLVKSLPNDESASITTDDRKRLAKVCGLREDVILDNWDESYVRYTIKHLYNRLHTRKPLIVSSYIDGDTAALFSRTKTLGEWIGINMVEPYHQ